jgi:hypothetical protein
VRASTLSIPGSQTAYLTLLGSERAPQPAQIGRLSGSLLDVTLAVPLPLDSAVKLEWGDYFVLAEVRLCEERGGTYQTALHLMGGLFEAESLRRLTEVVSAWR